MEGWEMEGTSNVLELTERWRRRLKDGVNKPTNLELCCIVVSEESLRKEAWQMLLRQNPTKTELLCVIKHVEFLREEAQKLLLTIVQ